MKQKILALALAAALSVPALTSASNNSGIESTTFSVTSVSPSTVENYQANDITITGAGFSSIVQVGARLGKWTDDKKDDSDNTIALASVAIVNDTTITATVPAGAEAGDIKKITVFDSGVTPNVYFTLDDALTVHPSFTVNDKDGDNDGIVEVYQTNAKSAQAVFSLTVAGQSYKNKKWLKVQVGNKKGVITRITRTGGNSVVWVKFKYGKMAAGNYDISLTYKNGLKKAVTKKGKTKYKTIWESGTMGNGNAFSVLLQPLD